MKILTKYFLFIILPFFVVGQNHFDFNDTIFKTGQTMELDVIYDLTGKKQVHSESYPLMDSIADFLKSNKGLYVEFGVYFSFLDDSKSYNDISRIYAKCVYDFIEYRGIDNSRISYNGYGDTLIIVNKEINDKYNFLKIDQPLSKKYYESLNENEKKMVWSKFGIITVMKINKIE